MWQVALAARVSKYGISLEQALWHIPLAVLNQLAIYDDLVCGRQPRWATDGHQGAQDLEALLTEALTASG